MRHLSFSGSGQDRLGAPAVARSAVMTWLAVVVGVAICAAATLLL